VKTSGKEVLRWSVGSEPVQSPDDLAVEEPLEIQVETRSVSVTMRTPGNDDELSAGFLLSEGLISRPDDIAKITSYPRNDAKNVISVFLDPNVQLDFQRFTRHVFASSSCGICGAATIEAVHKSFPLVTANITVRAADLLALPDRLRRSQETFDRTGGLHAAGVFDLRGEPLVIREDVGRHNAVDKVLGFGLLKRLLPYDQHVLVVSGRASFEIMQKALAGRIPIVVAVSAPSSLAVEFAEQSGQTLVGFVRDERLNVYSNAERVRFDEMR
jgi:FdhD protein